MSRPSARAWRESALVFDCQGDELLGVLSSPAAGVPASGVGVLIVVGGPQYRAGSHRQFVQLARTLAAQGHECLRFDYRGMGDSSGAARDFEQVDADIEAAVQALRRERPTLRKLVLWGLCDGASASLLYLHTQRAHAEIDGLVLLNPWVRSEDSLAKTQVKHYYTQRLREKAFWLKLLRGGVGLGALGGLLSSLRRLWRSRPAGDGSQDAASSPRYQQRMMAAWSRFTGPVLLVLSGQDLVARECADFLASAATVRSHGPLMSRLGTTLHEAPAADHTFSSLAESAQLEQTLLQWLARHIVPAASLPLARPSP